MYNKITNLNSSPPLAPTPILSQQRIYSFSESLSNTEHVSNFLEEFNECEQLLNINHSIANVIMVNCDDRELLDGMIADQGLNKHIKERMKKYLGLGDYVAIGCPYLPHHTTNNSNTHNRTMSTKNKEPKQSSAVIVSSVPIQTSNYTNKGQPSESQEKHHKEEISNPLSTSRYEIKESRLVTNKLPYKETTPRSKSNSSANSNNKFSRIELKSVHKMDKKESRPEDKKNKVTANDKKYKISKRDDKCSKNMTNQVAILKASQNNTLTVSRLRPSKQTISPKNQSPSLEKESQTKRINLSPTNNKIQGSRLNLNAVKNIKENSNTNLNGSRKESYFEPSAGCNNLVTETVHKSLEFFNMIKIMNN